MTIKSFQIKKQNAEYETKYEYNWAEIELHYSRSAAISCPKCSKERRETNQRSRISY